MTSTNQSSRNAAGSSAGRLRVGDLRAALAHLSPDDIVCVQVRSPGQQSASAGIKGRRIDDLPDLLLLTGVAEILPSDVIGAPIGSDPVSEPTVAVVVLDAYDDRPRP